MFQLNTAVNKYNKALEESKSTMESINKFQKDLIISLNQSLSDLETFKQELVNIVISEKSDEDKLKELRISILKFNAIEIKLTFPSSNGEIRNKLNEEVLLVLESIEEYGAHALTCALQFKEKIANVIRDQDITVENKIEAIANILM